MYGPKPILTEDVVAILESFEARRDGQQEWLKENHPECQKEQKHLDGRRIERAYWHYGYMVALSDMINHLRGEFPVPRKYRYLLRKNRAH